ncbi:hypothetical protein DVH05_017711 [Phytophthora capsici]|nr:hypothetical protein DVH05_015066 [Phytophthora capsici]KAG1696801.1 hypothetical protein DVH05_017711 [Phytophthora capsici]
MGKASAASKVHLANNDYRISVGWMEDKENFDWIHGTSDKAIVSGKQECCFQRSGRAPLHYLNKPKTPALNAATMRSRWSFYKTKYVSTLKAKTSKTGKGFTPQELNNGMRLEDKVNEMYPHFNRMDKLFREEPNVQPAGTL